MTSLRRALNVVLIVALLPLGTAFIGSNKATAIPKPLLQDSVKWSAQDSTYTDNDNHTIKLYGKASIANSITRVDADYIEYNSKEKTGTAKGNVVLYDISKNIIAKSSEAAFKMR